MLERVAALRANLRSHDVGRWGAGRREAITHYVAAVVARAVAAKYASALAALDLQDDDNLVVVGARNRTLEDREPPVLDDLGAQAEGGTDPRFQLSGRREFAL